jgi:hypothetical protein
MVVRPLGDIGRGLHHALHQRLLRNELQTLFVALIWRTECAYRENQLDHRPPVFKRSRTIPMWHFEWGIATLRSEAPAFWRLANCGKIRNVPREIVPTKSRGP